MRTQELALVAILIGWATASVAEELTAPAAGGTSPADAPAAVQAVWIERKVKFIYSARTAFYSCDGLTNKVKRILAAIDARPGYVVTARACFNPQHGAEWTPMLDITVASAIEATPAALEEAAKQAQQQVLVARAGGKTGPVEPSVATFPAVVRRIDLRDSPRGLLQPGDCELVEQLRDQVFKPLGAKIVVDRMGCTYRRLDNNIIVLSIDVLAPVKGEAPAG
ncbi:MAG: hypothetical protein U1F09_14740 [Steroidobacteraceae bacterium]